MRLQPHASHASRRKLLASLLAVPAIKLHGSEPKPDVPAYNNMSDDQEVSLGRDIAKSLEKDRKFRFIESPDIHSHFNDAFQKIAESSRRPNMPYSLKIVDTKTDNAFALPGGFVYLFRGLIESCENENEVMAALAHEVGHVAAHHAANALCRAKAADSLFSEASRVLLGGEEPAHILEQIGGPIAALALLKYDRNQELEADLLGFYNIQRAGWHPNGMLRLFKRFDDSTTLVETVLNFASDHPTPAYREQQIVQEMKECRVPDNLAVTSSRFREVQAKVKALPPPRTNTSQRLGWRELKG
jgi:beta-barrel assembly-enhancing protease